MVSLYAVFGLAAQAPLSSFLNFYAVCLVSPWVVKRSGLDGVLILDIDRNGLIAVVKVSSVFIIPASFSGFGALALLPLVVGSRLVKSGSYLVFHGLFDACLARGSFRCMEQYNEFLCVLGLSSIKSIFPLSSPCHKVLYVYLI